MVVKIIIQSFKVQTERYHQHIQQQLRIILFYTNMNKSIITFLLLLITIYQAKSATYNMVPLSQEILRNIFDNNQYLLIYISEQPTQRSASVLSTYCKQNPICVTLYKNNNLYDSIRQFVTHSAGQYLLILDAPRQQKYVRQIKKDQQIKVQDISNFYQGFISRQLEPYYSSEQTPLQQYKPCRKLVGNNLDHFLNLQAPLKVIYLYTQDHSHCQVCGQFLRGFADIAQKIFRQDVIIFGYFDIQKNDHPKIPNEIAPFFLVFKEGQDQPYGIQGERYEQLQNAIINIIAKHLYPDYKVNGQDEQIKVDVDDIEQINIQEFNSDQNDGILNMQL